MKQLATKYRKPILILSLTILLILFSLPTAVAGEVREGEVIHIKAGEVVNDDLFAVGNEIIIDGLVKGDVIAFAQSVTVNGLVEEDLMAGAQAVTIDGEVGDDLRVGAMAILIDGIVGDDIMASVFSFESGPESNIGGDLFVGSFQALVDGELAGDLNAGVGGLKISGQVGGNVNTDVGEASGGPSPVNFMTGIPNVPPMPNVPMGLTLDDRASVAGDLTYHSSARGNVNQAAVAGQVEFIEVKDSADAQGAGFGAWLWNQTQRLLRLLLAGALAAWLGPAFVNAAGQKLQKKLWPSLGWGALTPFIFLVLLIGLGLIGILVGFSLLVFGTFIFAYLLILFYLGAIVVGQYLGYLFWRRVRPDRAESTIWTTLTGLVGVWLLTLIPILGVIVGFFIILFGAGSLWLVGYERMRGISGEEAVATVLA